MSNRDYGRKPEDSPLKADVERYGRAKNKQFKIIEPFQHFLMSCMNFSRGQEMTLMAAR